MAAKNRISVSKFKTYQEGDRHIIESLAFPRFRGVIAFNNSLSDIEEITLIDQVVEPMILARVMREAGEFLINQNKYNE